MKYLVRDGSTVGYATFCDAATGLNKPMMFTEARRKNPASYRVMSGRLVFDLGKVPSYCIVAGAEHIRGREDACVQQSFDFGSVPPAKR